jgi:hypothetical protein
MTEITSEMLDIIEQVKGKRNPELWDNRCESAMKRKNAEKLDKKTKKS